MTFLDDLGTWGTARDAAKFAEGAASRNAEVERLTAERDARDLMLTELQAEYDAFRADHPAVLANLDLAGISNGPLTGATLAARMGATTTANGVLANMSVGADPDGRRYVETLVKAGKFGGSSGSSSIFKLTRAVPEATIRYEGMVSPNFVPVKGGKLPGLAGAVDGYPVGLAAGNQSDPDAAAMSMRVMWRAGAKLVSYVYHVGQARPEGDDVPWSGAVLVPGQKFTIEQHHRLNDPGQANGVLEAWLNGTKVLDIHDFTYRRQDRANLLLGYIYWSVFPGGNDATWGFPIDTWVRIYDGLTVTTPA